MNHRRHRCWGNDCFKWKWVKRWIINFVFFFLWGFTIASSAYSGYRFGFALIRCINFAFFSEKLLGPFTSRFRGLGVNKNSSDLT